MVEQTRGNRPKLSVCIICRDAEDKIDACLAAVRWADEIVIVDSGSKDDTLNIAARYTDNIHTRADWEGFGIQRQRAEKLASHDWIFALDTDEVVSEALAQEILDALAGATDDSVFIVNRLTHFCGQFVYHSGWYPDRIARLYNRKRFSYNSNVVHESVDCKSATRVPLASDLFHYTFSDLHTYLAKRNQYACDWAVDSHRKGKSTTTIRALASSIFAFFRHYFLRKGFLDGRTGLLIAVIQMQYTFNKYMQLVCLQGQDVASPPDKGPSSGL